MSFISTCYDSPEQVTLYKPWTVGTNAHTWINSLVQHFPPRLQIFDITCPRTDYGGALFDAIKDAVDISGRPWTIDVHKLSLKRMASGRDLVGVTSHFRNVRHLDLNLDCFDGERSTLFNGAFEGMNLELLSITMNFDPQLFWSESSRRSPEDHDPAGYDVDGEGPFRACATVAQRLSEEMRRSGACRNLVSLKLILADWHDGLKDQGIGTTYESFVRAVGNLHPPGDRRTIRSLNLVATCSKDSCQDHRCAYSLCADHDYIDDSGGPPTRRNPPIDAFAEYPNLTFLRLDECGTVPEMFRRLGCRELKELSVTIIEKDDLGELLDSLRLPELQRLEKLRMNFGQLPGIDVDEGLYDGKWHRGDVIEEGAMIEKECRDRGIDVVIDYPSESGEEEDEYSEDGEGDNEGQSEDEE